MGCNYLYLPETPASDTQVCLFFSNPFSSTDNDLINNYSNRSKYKYAISMPCVYKCYSILYWGFFYAIVSILTHWGRVTHICVNELTIIVSDNGLSPGRRQAIIWNNAGLLLIEPLGTNFSEISIGIQTFSFKKMHLNMSSAKWRPFCLGLNVLNKEQYKLPRITAYSSVASYRVYFTIRALCFVIAT